MPIKIEYQALQLARFINHEIPTPSPTGTAVVFTTTYAYETNSLRAFRDQSVLLIGSGQDFTETTSTTFTVSAAPDSDEVLWVCYVKR